MTFNENKVKEAIEALSESEKVELWNARCEGYRYEDEYIDYNDPDELLYGQKPSDVLSSVNLGEYSLNDEYVCNTIYGYASFDYVTDDNSPFDIDELIEWYFDEGYEQTDLLDYEELIEDEDEEDEDEE